MMRRLMLAALGAAAAVAMMAGPAAAALGPNLVRDGAFEVPKLAGDSQTFAAGQKVGPWHVTGAGVRLVGSAVWQPFSGSQSLTLNADDAGGVYQDVAGLVVGQTYRVQWSLAADPSGPNSQLALVWFGGQQIVETGADPTGETPTDMHWLVAKRTVTATATTERLQFDSQTAGAHGLAIDGVKVETCDMQPGNSCR